MPYRTRFVPGGDDSQQVVDEEWIPFPGGELEGRRPKHLCDECRARKARFRHAGVVKADRSHTLCFQCYRAELDRLRPRRSEVAAVIGRLWPPAAPAPIDLEAARYEELARRRRLAQIAARHALARGELRLPEAWVPFASGAHG